MSTISSFPPLASDDAKVLVLGSMPGIKSLQLQQYYGHPRNAFWPIMAAFFGSENNPDYQQKKALLAAHKIALWDVLQSCYRPGSLDSAITQESMISNNFISFFNNHPKITEVYFNGAAAEKIFNRLVLIHVQDSFSYINYHRLPSTSPAHAAMNLTEKIEKWQILQLAVKSNANL